MKNFVWEKWIGTVVTNHPENTARWGQRALPRTITMLPRRKTLPHGISPWVDSRTVFLITICTQARGRNQLCNPEIAKWLFSSMEHYQQQGNWWIHLALLMPDHLHILTSFGLKPGMRKSISQWKRYVARKQGIKWQRDFFDHRLRSNESLEEKAHYIRMNPVRAGLVDRPENWPYVWTK